jgi:cellulose biosynthesis protein BcsQ
LTQLLVEKGADVNAVGKDGGGNLSTPLWWAAKAVYRGTKGGLALAQLLVEKGADVNAVGEDGDEAQGTPLWWATRAVHDGRVGGLDLAKLLIESGADRSSIDPEFSTRRGSSADELELARLLISKAEDEGDSGIGYQKNGQNPRPREEPEPQVSEALAQCSDLKEWCEDVTLKQLPYLNGLLKAETLDHELLVAELQLCASTCPEPAVKLLVIELQNAKGISARTRYMAVLDALHSIGLRIGRDAPEASIIRARLGAQPGAAAGTVAGTVEGAQLGAATGEHGARVRAKEMDCKAGTPTHSIVFCNNRGGAGKTFMAFQTACEAARARPEKKVLVIDFSLYGDVTTLLLGGAAKQPDGDTVGFSKLMEMAPTMDTRVEGLVRDLENATDVKDLSTAAPTASNSFFGQLFGRRASAVPTQAPSGPVDLTKYTIQPSTANEAIPSNLYLIPSAGRVSWSEANTSTGAENEVPLLFRKDDGWYPAGRRLAAAAAALPEDFDAIFVDTDHLASCVLTKLALTMCDSVVVPLSLNNDDNLRLYVDSTDNALFTDVMIPMMEKQQLRAKVHRMVFTRVLGTESPFFTPFTPTSVLTEFGRKSPFNPTVAGMKVMDLFAAASHTSNVNKAKFRSIFKDVDDIRDTQIAFAAMYFSAMQSIPDLTTQISERTGVPICTMTTERYEVLKGHDGDAARKRLMSMKAQLQALVISMTSEDYSKPPDYV